MTLRGLRGIEPALGRYDFDGKGVAGTRADAGDWRDGEIHAIPPDRDAFTLSVFMYVPSADGYGLKRSRSVSRVRGYFDGRKPGPARAFGKASLICGQLEGGHFGKLYHVHVYRVRGLQEFDYYAPNEDDAIANSMILATHSERWKRAECYIVGVSEESHKCSKLIGGHIPDCEMLERDEKFHPHGLGLRIAKDEDLLAELRSRRVSAETAELVRAELDAPAMMEAAT